MDEQISLCLEMVYSMQSVQDGTRVLAYCNLILLSERLWKHAHSIMQLSPVAENAGMTVTKNALSTSMGAKGVLRLC